MVPLGTDPYRSSLLLFLVGPSFFFFLLRFEVRCIPAGRVELVCVVASRSPSSPSVSRLEIVLRRRCITISARHHSGPPNHPPSLITSFFPFLNPRRQPQHMKTTNKLSGRPSDSCFVCVPRTARLDVINLPLLPFSPVPFLECNLFSLLFRHESSADRGAESFYV